MKTLGEPAAVLGTASIVGAGAFNLLVISGISIVSVDEPKKIYDVGVYACTATFSLLAYFWMFVVLSINTPGLVTSNEAYLTLGFMVVLVTIAFSLDKFQQGKDKKSQTDEDKKKERQAVYIKSLKCTLIEYAKKFGEGAIMNIVRGKD